MQNGVTIKTSGTSGEPKEIYQSPEKIKADALNAIDVQSIRHHSSIYTCLSLERAGGLFAQSIPALVAGAKLKIDKFSPYQYVREAHKYTHTHLTPKQAKAVMLTKGFQELDLNNKTFLIGSEPVTWDIIEAFLKRKAKVILIWGMTEIGVNAIMHVFNSLNEALLIKSNAPTDATLLGNIFYCDWKIKDNCLWVRGDVCVYDGWFNTKDKAIEQNGLLYYTGRKDTLVDFNKPRKG